MWNYDGHIVPVSEWRFGTTSSPGSTWTMPNEAWMPSENFPALCVVHQEAENTSATIPTLVTPSGWTAVSSGQGTLTNASGRGMRWNLCYKICTASDLGTVVTGMNGAQTNRICAQMLFFNRPLQSVTVVAGLPGMVASTASLGAAPVTGTDDNVRAHGHLWYGLIHGEATVNNGGDFTMDSVFTPFGGTYGAALDFADWGYGSSSSTKTLFCSYPYNDGSGLRSTSPTNSQMDDAGNWGFDSSMQVVKNTDSGSWNSCAIAGFHLD